MKAYTELVTEVLQDCQQAPEPLVARIARNVVMDFCERTLTIRRNLALITLQPDVATYVLTPPADTTIIQIMRAQVSDRDPLIGASQDQLDLWWRTPENSQISFDCCASSCDTTTAGENWRQWTSTYPQAYYIEKDGADYSIRLVAIPSETLADALLCNVALKPARTSTQIDNWFIEDHYLRLIDGVKAKVLMIPKRPWTDAELGMYYRGLYENSVTEEFNKSSRDFVRDDQSTGRVKAWS